MPIMYALMGTRSEAAYNQVIDYFKTQIVPTLAPELIITDFERGLQNSLQNNYREAQVKGCFFHYAQVGFLAFIMNYRK